jgi:hypothetical protein
VTVECSPRLQGLLERSFPGRDFRPEQPGPTDVSGFDLQIPGGSLAGLYRRRIEDFPANGAYLRADPARVEEWRDRLAALGPGAKIGISWRSQNYSWRKLPFHSSLAEWEAIFAVPGLVFVNLQWEDFAAEIAQAENACGRRINTPDGLDLKNDVEGTAALLCALDCVVSCRNTVNWLAGALGVPALVLAAHPNEMMLEAARDPWFGSAEIFYREHGEDWRRAAGMIAGILAERFPSA